jgi:hypothetical protein
MIDQTLTLRLIAASLEPTMTETNERTLSLSHDCKLTHSVWGGIPDRSVSLEYVEHSTDHWHSDSETSVDIYENDARQIIAFLQAAFPNLK